MRPVLRPASLLSLPSSTANPCSSSRLLTTSALHHRRRRSSRLFGVALLSAGAASVWLLSGPVVRLESPQVSPEKRQYGTVKLVDTADHPRNYKMAVSTAEQASKLLRANEKSFAGRNGSGIASISFNQVASNSPIEDDHVEMQSADGWSCFGIFDGHGGWSTSSFLSRELAPRVLQALQARSDAPQEAIADAFEKLDQEIVYTTADRLIKAPKTPRPKAVEQLMPALSGSCALLSSYDAHSKALYVAVTGDSRAILGKPQPDGAYTIEALSIDQTGSTPSEQDRLRREHPAEHDTVVRNGRILGGLEPSRAFGDARYKWSAEVQSKLSSLFYGRRAPANLKTPPYVTARPEVTRTVVSEGAFLVMGSDGLYEMLSNAEICELVAGWQTRHASSQARPSSWVPSFLQSQKQSAPKVVDLDRERSAASTGQKAPSGSSQQAKKQFVYEDANVATHIIRNALGAGNQDMLWGLLSLPYPLSRSYRDDISVTVVFFGEQADEVADAPIKAKL